MFYYAAGAEKRIETYSRAEGDQLHARYQSSGDWIFMHSHNHQEGRIYYYWRAAP